MAPREVELGHTPIFNLTEVFILINLVPPVAEKANHSIATAF